MMLQVAQLVVAFVAAGAYIFIMLLPFIQVCRPDLDLDPAVVRLHHAAAIHL